MRKQYWSVAMGDTVRLEHTADANEACRLAYGMVSAIMTAVPHGGRRDPALKAHREVCERVRTFAKARDLAPAALRREYEDAMSSLAVAHIEREGDGPGPRALRVAAARERVAAARKAIMSGESALAR